MTEGTTPPPSAAPPAAPKPPNRTRPLALACAGLLALAAIAAAALWASETLDGPGPLAAPRDLVIPRGSPDSVAATLQAAGIIPHPLPFRAAAWLTRNEGPLRAGEFAFPAEASLRTTLSILRTARPVQHRLTIPEGLTAAQIALLLDRTDTLSGETPIPAEGAILPQTYAFERATPRTTLAARAAAAMDRAVAETWASRTPDLPLASPAELVTLASIVEREAVKPEERATIAGVFINRLRRNMRLQADPTATYAATGGTSLDRPPTRADLENPNPYNTYRNQGLPPGPIASPGLASLQATARPEPHDYLYFVADGTGGHAFARTLEEHNRNVARWRAGK